IVSECATPQYDSWIQTLDNPEKTLQKITDRIPFGNRMTTPQEVADTSIFLLSDRSSHTTGQLIHVDGGYVHLDRALIREDQKLTLRRRPLKFAFCEVLFTTIFLCR